MHTSMLVTLAAMTSDTSMDEPKWNYMFQSFGNIFQY